MKLKFKFIVSLSLVLSLLCQASYATEVCKQPDYLGDGPGNQARIIDFSDTFTLDFGDSNVLYYVFAPRYTTLNTDVYLRFDSCRPTYDDAAVRIEWEYQLFSETTWHSMDGYSDILEYQPDGGAVIQFQIRELSMYKTYRLKLTNVSSNGYYGSFTLSYMQ